MSRRPTWPLLGCVLLCALSLGGAAGTFSQRQARLAGALDGLPSLEMPYRLPGIGVNAELTAYTRDQLDENLALIAETGFTWVRQGFDWARIEPQPGEFNWADYDAVVEAAAEHDLRLVAVLQGSPAWASAAPGGPPRRPANFAAFARALAERYGDQLDYYQVWDEPNLSAGWGGQAPSAVEYAALLEASAEALRTADPGAYVLLAGLAPTVERGPQNISDVLYLRALYDNGAAPFFDGAAGKPYGFDTGPEDRRLHENLLNFHRLILLRQEMTRAGDADKLLWASHFGWNALPPGWAGAPSSWGQTSPEQQAAWTEAAYLRALTEWPWAGPLFLENWQPGGPQADARWGFALRGQDGQLNATAQALAARSQQFNEALWPGLYPAQVPLARYSSDWEFSDLGADVIENGRSSVSVPFAGDLFGVTARRDNYRAYLYVQVDGAASAMLPRDQAGRSYQVLTSADYQPRIEVLPLAQRTPGQAISTTSIEADRGWDQWAIAGYAVGSQVNTLSYDLVIGLLLIVSVLSGGFAVHLGRGMLAGQPLISFAEGLYARLGQALHLGLSMLAGLAVWIGAALSLGGALPNLLNRLGDGGSLALTALTAGLFYFSPWLVLTVVALVCYFWLIYLRPSAGLALAMFFTPYYLLPRPLFDRAFSMVEVTSLLTLAALVLHITAARKAKGWPSPAVIWAGLTPLDKAVGLFVGVAVASLAWADLRGVAVTELRQSVLEPAVMYLALRLLPMNDGERWRILDLLILTGVIVSLIGLVQSALGVNLITAEEGSRRLQSVFGTPNNAALFLGRLIPIAAAVGLMAPSGRRRWLYAAALPVMLAAAALTLSRGGLLLGIPAGLAVVLLLWNRRAGVALIGAGAALLALAVFPLSRIPRFAALFDFSSETSTNLFRLNLWQSTLRMIADHPITGLGLDQFLYQYRSRYILPEAWRQPDLSQPHNFLLNYWVRLGIVGLIAGIWMQVAFWQAGVKVVKQASAQNRAMAAGLLGAMAAFLTHGLVDEVHFVIDLAFIFFMSLGLMHQLAEEEIHAPDDQG